MKADKRILMIINEFPPVGESGVQRALKFLKYLDADDWRTYVITPAKATKTVLDHSLCEEIPPRTRVYKTFSWGFGGSSVDKVASIRQDASGKSGKGLFSRLLMSLNHFLFPIDKQIGWLPFAFCKAFWLIRRHKIRNVYITAFPFSAFLIGMMLKRCFGKRIFWVADYRDGWQFEPLIETVLPPRRMSLIRKLDRKVLQSCDRAVFVTSGIVEQYAQAYPELKGKMELITNGFDESDFEGLHAQTFDQPVMVYMGKIYNLHRSNIIPILELIKTSGLNLPLIHIGSLSEAVKAVIDQGAYDFYQFQGYKSHREALSIALGATINLLVINDDKASEGVYSGKLFELMRLRRPMLVLGPKQGIVKELIERTHAGEYVWQKDEAGTLAAIRRLMDSPHAYGADVNEIKQFDRKALSKKLGALYE